MHGAVAGCKDWNENTLALGRPTLWRYRSFRLRWGLPELDCSFRLCFPVALALDLVLKPSRYSSSFFPSPLASSSPLSIHSPFPPLFCLHTHHRTKSNPVYLSSTLTNPDQEEEVIMHRPIEEDRSRKRWMNLMEVDRELE